MNLFLLSWNIAECAAYHCDKHVVKMILELTQMLFCAHIVSGSDLSDIPVPKYKKTHESHPVSIWVRETLSNYYFTACLGLQLCNEYTRRYSKYDKDGNIKEVKIHSCQQCLQWLLSNPPAIPQGVITEPAVAMYDGLKVYVNGKLDPVASYRNCYNKEKSRFAKWKMGGVPQWYINEYNPDESKLREEDSKRKQREKKSISKDH